MSARPHFSIARIPVRIEPVFFVIAGLWGLRWIDFGIDVVGLWIVASFISILVHELGHGFAFKAFGHPSAIVLHGFGGVTISHRRSTLTRARSIVVTVAGSLTALAVLWLPTRQLLASDVMVDWPDRAVILVYFLSFQNLWWSVVNLLPIRPLDGGNVTAEVFGIDRARRISIVAAIAGAIWAFFIGQGYGAFFALFLAFNNWQEIRAAQSGADVDAFGVDAPDPGAGPAPKRRGNLAVVPPIAPTAADAAVLDPARAAQQAWAALRAGDGPTAHRLVRGLGQGADPFLRAAAALSVGDPQAFELFETAYVAVPGGPSNLVATEVLARSKAATAIARRLVSRADGRGREGAGSLQTHLHYAGRFTEAAEVGEVVYQAGPPSPAQTAFEVACSWARAGQVDRAAHWLEQAADAGFRAATLVDGEPDLAPLRTDPRWPVLRARLT